MTARQERATPEEWSAFCSTIKELGVKSLTYSTTFERASIYAPRYKGQAHVNFNETPPVFDHLEDANDCIARLWTYMAKRLSRLQGLEELVGKNSRNSSRPPSMDTLADKAKRHCERQYRPSGKKQGAQQGHIGTSRKLSPLSAVDDIVDCHAPRHCPDCTGLLTDESMTQRKQVSYLAQKKLTVTEYRLYKAYCPNCQRYYRGALPDGTPSGAFGACVHSMVSTLTGRYHLSKREVKNCLYDLFGLKISTGSVANIENRVSDALFVLTDEVNEALKESAFANVDETTHYRCHQLAWLWTIANRSLAYFSIQSKRNQETARRLLGDCQEVTRTTDRFAIYSFIPNLQHQFCWAHLIRDIQAISESSDRAQAKIGHRLEAARVGVFEDVRALKRIEETKQSVHKQQLLDHIKQFRQMLREGATLKATRTGVGFVRSYCVTLPVYGVLSIIRTWIPRTIMPSVCFAHPFFGEKNHMAHNPFAATVMLNGLPRLVRPAVCRGDTSPVSLLKR